jgi:ABC-type nickel/cobalt efflux system permease component RcnA
MQAAAGRSSKLAAIEQASNAAKNIGQSGMAPQVPARAAHDEQAAARLKALRRPPPARPPERAAGRGRRLQGAAHRHRHAHQQQIALQWLVREACGKAHFPYYGDRTHDTAFALGRQFVGDLVVGLFNADLSSLRRAPNVETTVRSS